MKSVLVDDIFHLLQTAGGFQIGLVVHPGAPLDADRLGRALAPSLTNMGRIDPQSLMFGGRPVEQAYLLAPIVRWRPQKH